MKKSSGMLLFLVLTVFILIEILVGIPFVAKKKEEVIQNIKMQYNPYDIKISSETGFLEEEVNSVKEIEGINEIESMLSEILEVQDENNFTFKIKANSMPDKINKPMLIEGSMPQKSDECVIKEGETSLAIGDNIYIEDGEENKKYTITGIISFPFVLGNEDIANTIYFHKDAFNLIAKKTAYITVSSRDINKTASLIESKLNQIRQEGFQIRIEEAEEKVNDAKTELKEKQEEISNLSSEEKETLLAKQKALGKMELKIDQDEANRYDASQIAARRKELEAQKQSIAEKLGAYNDTYYEIKEKEDAAKIELESAQKELEQIEYSPIKLETKKENLSYITFEKNIQENANVIFMLPICFLIITVTIGISGVNIRLGAKTLLFTMTIALILMICALQYHSNEFWGGNILLAVSCVGIVLIFSFGMMSKMKKRVRQIKTNKNVKIYPKRIVMHLIWENQITYIFACIFAGVISIAIFYIYKPLAKLKLENYFLVLGISVLLQIVLNIRIYSQLKRIS